jgi:hypothetical protein
LYAVSTMENEKALDILKGLLGKPGLSTEEKEAVTAAVGLLSLAVLSKSKIKALKDRRSKSTEW